MTNPLNLVKQLDSATPSPQQKREKLKSRRVKRQEMRDRIKSAKQK